MLNIRNHWLFFLAGALALIVVGILVDRRMRDSLDSARWVSHTHEVLEALKTLESRLNNAESEQRAYVLMGDNPHLERYYQRIVPLDDDLKVIAALVADQAEQSQRATRLAELVSQRRARLGAVVAVRQSQGTEAAVAMIAEGTGGALMEKIRDLLHEMEARERALLTSRAAISEENSNRMLLVTPAGGTLAILLLGAAVAMARRESERRRDAEKALRSAHAELGASLDRSQRTARRRQNLHQLGEMLQSCVDLDEAARIVQRWMSAHGPAGAGGLCLLNASENLIEARATWGDFAAVSNARFTSDDCWAMRRGSTYSVADVGSGIICQHVHGEAGAACSVCMPLVAQGHSLGILYLRGEQAASGDDEWTGYLNDITAQLGLAVSNLRLQESLRTQSIRDPLTGLFNRRYLEASMQRELARAQRAGQEVAVIILDVDHFKRFNDTHGHDAGDALLAELGGLLKQFGRSDDVACRYGGEEFVLLLPEIDFATAQARAEQLLAAIRNLPVRVRKDRINGITASLGLAMFPRHGRSGEALVSAADQALYRAKHAGRDRVCIAEGGLLAIEKAA